MEKTEYRLSGRLHREVVRKRVCLNKKKCSSQGVIKIWGANNGTVVWDGSKVEFS